MTFDKILAKSDPEQELTEHTADCLQWFGRVLIWKRQLIKSVCERYQLDYDFIIKRLFLTVAFHDAGKNNLLFQLKVRGLPLNGSHESHPLASIPFIYYFTQQDCITIRGLKYFPEALAILSHHSKLHPDIYEGYQNFAKNIQYAERKHLDAFFDRINQYADQLSVPSWKPIGYEKKIANINPLDIVKGVLLPNVNRLTDNPSDSVMVRELFMLFKSVLHYSDWLASARKQEHEYSYSSSETIDSITQTMITQLSNRKRIFEKWESFQIKTSEAKQHVFVQIPTGQGKTEASLLWAVNQNQGQKIIYLLPTMVTTNKMWARMEKFFGKNQTGLSHSTAKYVINEANDHQESQDLRFYDLYDKSFFRPVSVATIDQLIYSFFNWGYWVLTGSAAFNAKIIIDEIHIYDGYTLGLILTTLKHLAPYNTQFAIMSASLPEILKEEIEKVLPSNTYEIIKERAFDEKQRHILAILDENVQTYIEEIFNSVKNKKKVLIVCNTIKEARKIFDLLAEIPDNQKMLYHSQFILKDKKTKEDILDKINELKEGFVAICTQIVEVSLDIDFDVLYSENAPIDALIQRLGRVNRKGEIEKRTGEKFAQVFIYQETEISRKWIYSPKLLDETRKFLQEFIGYKNGNLKEKDYKTIVDLVYTRPNLEAEGGYYKDLKEGKELIAKVWKDVVKNIYTLLADQKTLESVISSRKIRYITVDCILNRDFSEIYQLIENKRFDKINEFIVKVPFHVAKKYLVRNMQNEFFKRDLYCLDVQYDGVRGITFHQDDLSFM
ncbi:MAG: CRISPR-associated helicase Cas3' [Runella sp.]